MLPVAPAPPYLPPYPPTTPRPPSDPPPPSPPPPSTSDYFMLSGLNQPWPARVLLVLGLPVASRFELVQQSEPHPCASPAAHSLASPSPHTSPGHRGPLGRDCGPRLWARAAGRNGGRPPRARLAAGLGWRVRARGAADFLGPPLRVPRPHRRRLRRRWSRSRVHARRSRGWHHGPPPGALPLPTAVGRSARALSGVAARARCRVRRPPRRHPPPGSRAHARPFAIDLMDRVQPRLPVALHHARHARRASEQPPARHRWQRRRRAFALRPLRTPRGAHPRCALRNQRATHRCSAAAAAALPASLPAAIARGLWFCCGPEH